MEETLGKRIVQNRKRLMLTQDQLAEKLGVTAQAVSKWENDQSCPDITMLPKLAEIFGISTDELLGMEPPPKVVTCEVVDGPEDSGLHAEIGSFKMHWDSGRKAAVGFAVFVLVSGLLLLFSNLLKLGASFWEIIWPTALLMFGIWGLFPKFSFFRLGCALFGSYFLLDHLHLLPITLGIQIILPALIILLGMSLLADALKKPNKGRFHVERDGQNYSQKLNTDNGFLTYTASFGESIQHVTMDTLCGGEISTNFGEYTVDLSGISSVAPECVLDLKCSFGELRLLVPKQHPVRPASSTAFASVEIIGEPDPAADTALDVNAHVSFGEITIEYI